MKITGKFAFLILSAAALCFIAPGCASPRSEKPDDYMSSDDQAPTYKLKWEDDYYNVNAGQQIVNIRTGEWSAMAEAQLYLVYDNLVASLNCKSQTALMAEQAKWLKARNRKAKTIADEFEGGTLGPAESSSVRGNWNSKRLQTLGIRLGKLKNQNPPTVKANCLPSKLVWFPSIFILSSDEDFWADEMVKRDKYRTWHHWEEFQDMKLQVAYAYLNLNLPANEWQSVAKESESWPEEKSHLLAQSAASADEKDKLLGRAASKRFAGLETRFAILKFSPDPSGN